MDQEQFTRFYERYARGLWAYIARVSGDPAAADDLCQEAFLRLLASKFAHHDDEAHTRNYLYRIATNLLRDRHRFPKNAPTAGALDGVVRPAPETGYDVRNALSRLRRADRELLWLAYVEGASHEEIAAVTGYTRLSIRPLLSRARGRLAAMLKGKSR